MATSAGTSLLFTNSRNSATCSTESSIPSHPATQDQVTLTESRDTSGSGYPFVIVRVEDGRPLGTVGLWLKESDEGRASLGYWVVGSARGQGVAAEALRAVAAWALGDLQIPRLQLYVEPWNAASQRTAERVGFRREGLLRSCRSVQRRRRGYSK
ncbi:GNAT family protein [Streptomyces sp. SCSIO 30461]|uniref:GNAT family N-acetyltransferase n=1 Tax=Streptomyces sp. SCSIO 30461 TaxID=3118085 RepID=UPI0030D5F553